MPDPSALADELVPASEAAIELHLMREAVVRRIQTGVLPGQRIGGRWYVLRSSIEAARQAADVATPVRAFGER